MLVYTTPQRSIWLKGRIEFAETVNMNTDAATLRQLEVWVNSSYHKVLLAENPEVMRGYDYRGGYVGICLIVDRGFENLREAE